MTAAAAGAGAAQLGTASTSATSPPSASVSESFESSSDSDDEEEELRYAVDGELYTKEQFEDWYGDNSQTWNQSVPEKRLDAQGQEKTKAQFEEAGESEYWPDAEPYDPNAFDDAEAPTYVASHSSDVEAMEAYAAGHPVNAPHVPSNFGENYTDPETKKMLKAHRDLKKKITDFLKKKHKPQDYHTYIMLAAQAGWDGAGYNIV